MWMRRLRENCLAVALTRWCDLFMLIWLEVSSKILIALIQSRFAPTAHTHAKPRGRSRGRGSVKRQEGRPPQRPPLRSSAAAAGADQAPAAGGVGRRGRGVVVERRGR